MTQRYHLTTKIIDSHWPEEAVGLILPVPPTTANQRVEFLEIPSRWEGQEITAKNAPQQALLMNLQSGLLSQSFGTTISIPQGVIDQAQFEPYEMASLMPGADAQVLYTELAIKRLDPPARLDQIINCLVSKFNYQHGTQSELPLTCDALIGNCLDINSAFIKLLRLAGIGNAYYIGYFFEQGQPLEQDDWHCWVDTISTRGYENWDIAHYLKRGETKIHSALNPIDGIRFAMSTGRDLLFESTVGNFITPHLCEPRWVMTDGKTKTCRVVVNANLLLGEIDGD